MTGEPAGRVASGIYLVCMRTVPVPAFAMPSLAALGAFLVLCFGVATIGGAITSDSVATWYPTLAKPAITPPAIAFPIVWTTLFALMAIAAWLVWRANGLQGARGALLLFALQLMLNLGWSALFFGARQIGWALAELVLLWLAIAATALAFRRHDRRAAWLLLPYLAWVSYAGLLNALIWQANR